MCYAAPPGCFTPWVLNFLEIPMGRGPHRNNHLGRYMEQAAAAVRAYMVEGF